MEDHIQKAFDTPGLIESVLQQAVQEALLVHKKLGNPIAEWRNGRAVWVPPEEIDLPETATKGRVARGYAAPGRRLRAAVLPLRKVRRRAPRKRLR